jgi:hypothetical protein
MTDEHIIRALADGSGTTPAKIFYTLAGRPTFQGPDGITHGILDAGKPFLTAENGKGRLHQSIIDFLHDATHTKKLRTVAPIVDLHSLRITAEFPSPKPTTKKRKATTSPPAAKGKRKTSVPQRTIPAPAAPQRALRFNLEGKEEVMAAVAIPDDDASKDSEV